MFTHMTLTPVLTLTLAAAAIAQVSPPQTNPAGGHQGKFPGWVSPPCWYDTNDCNGNGVPDACDIQSGTSNDCDGDGVPDDCAWTECRIEIVFLMDTSTSMCEEAAALCDAIQDIECDLYNDHGRRVQSHVWGITYDSYDYCNTGDPCVGLMTTTVLDELGPIVPGNPTCCGVLDECFGGNSENWGPAISIVSELFPWDIATNVRLVIPVTDEGPYCGNTCENPGFDLEALEHAIAMAQANGVKVSPIVGTGGGDEACVQNLATLIADATGGTMFLSVDAQNDLSDGLFDIIWDSCNPGGDVEICSGGTFPSACPCGNSSTLGLPGGCVNSTGVGAHLTTSGTASLTADTLLLSATGMPDSFAIYTQGLLHPAAPTGAPFGDGLLCASGAIQLGIVSNQGGSSSFPGALDPPLSIVGGIITAGTSVVYQVQYADRLGPCGTGFNLSSAVEVVWAP